MNASSNTLHTAERIGRILLSGMEEILGRNELDDLLIRASQSGIQEQIQPFTRGGNPSCDIFNHVPAALEDVYGLQAGRGLALRAGRACFHQGLREFGAETGLTGMEFRLLPSPTRLLTGSRALAAYFNQSGCSCVSLEADQMYTYWHMEGCPLCHGRDMDSPSCHLMVGFLQAALNWTSGGKTYLVEETGCIACGGARCTFRIDKTPLK